MVVVIRFKSLATDEVMVSEYPVYNEEVKSMVNGWRMSGYSVLVAEKGKETKNGVVWKMKPTSIYKFFKWWFANILIWLFILGIIIYCLIAFF